MMERKLCEFYEEFHRVQRFKIRKLAEKNCMTVIPAYLHLILVKIMIFFVFLFLYELYMFFQINNVDFRLYLK